MVLKTCRAALLALCLALGANAYGQALSDSQRLQISEARNERDWPKVIRLLEEARSANPNDAEIILTLADAYTVTQHYAAAQALLTEHLAKAPDCFACYPALWEANTETADRSSGSMEETRGEIHQLEARRSDIPREALGDYLQAIYRGYEILEDHAEQERIAALIIEKADQGLAHYYLAERAFADLLRRQPDMTPEKFVQRFPDYYQVDLVFNLELTRRLKAARVDPSKQNKVKHWARLWLKARPKSRQAWAQIARAYEKLGIRKWRTSRYFKRALRLTDKHPEIDREPLYSDEAWKERLLEFSDSVRIDQAHYQARTDHAKKAREILTPLEQRNAFNGHYLYGRAQVAKTLGLQEEAKDYFIRTLDRRMHSAASLRALSELRNEPDLTLEKLRAERAAVLQFPHFTDVTDAVGLTGVKGAWVAWGDYDRDGKEDLLIGEGATLLHQERAADGTITFRNVWAKVMPKGLTHIQSGVFGDFDRDGDLDLYVADGQDGSGTYNRLLVNRVREGKGFVDETAARMGIFPSHRTAAAAWGDYDHDGYLDLYVANFERPGERIGYGYPDLLFHNLKGKRFKEVSKEAGMVSPEPMCGRGATWADFNNDGLLDLYVSNYRLDPNFLFQNNGAGHFTDVAGAWKARGVQVNGKFGHSIGSEFGDLNNDGNLDLVVCNLAHPRALAYSNRTQVLMNELSEGHFVDTFKTSGIQYEETHSDPSLGDLDNDGDLDLIITAVYPGHPITIYQNDGSGHFTDVSFASGITINNSWGAALADFDGDGDLDLAVASPDGIRLFRNDGLTGQHWLTVKPLDAKSKGIAIGARVTVETADGQSQVREVEGGKGTGNEHALAVHFGFGAQGEPVTVRVRFPDGLTVTKRHVTVDQVLTVSLKP